MEIVRACLRVLKHHNVISLVDMFCYSNRYECTERIRLDSKLLHESVDYVIKRRNPQHPSSKTSPGCETDSPTRRGLGPMSPSHRPDISQCHTLSSSVQTDYSLRENSYPRMASGGSYGREVPLTDLLKPAEIEEIKMAVADFIYGCGRHTTIGEHWISLISTVTTKAPVTPHGGVDWKKMFDIIDHRRLITFGVVHGTIRRVHNFPQLVGMSKANECYMTTDDAPAHTMLDDRSRQQHIVRYEQQQQKTALVNKAASLLNGLRCDDELVCSLELPLSAILAFFPEESVISVYATD